MSLRKNISYTFIGNVIYSGCQWLMLTTLAKLSSPQTVGQYSIALAITAPIFAFSNLQLRGIQSTDIKDEYTFSNYLGFRLISSLLSIIVVVITAISTNISEETVAIVIAIGVSKAVESVSDVLFGLFQKHEQMLKVATSMSIKGSISLVAFTASYYVFNSLFAASIALIVSWGIVMLLYDLKNAKEVLSTYANHRSIKPEISLRQFKNLFFLALPMGAVILLNTLNFNIPRYRIIELYGEADLGYYSAIASLLIVGSTIVNAIGVSATPRLAKYYQCDRKSYVKLVIKILTLSAIVGFIGIIVSSLLGRPILTIIFTKNYSNYSNVLVWTMVSACFLYCSTILGSSITAARSFISQFVVNAVITSIIAVGSYVFVQKYGIIGGAYALTLGFFIKFIGQLLQVIWLARDVVIFGSSRQVAPD